MAFALFYNREDLTPIAAEIGRADLTGADRQLANRVWNGGGRDWNTAPLAPPEMRAREGDADLRILVIDSTVTLTQFRDFLYRMAASVGSVGGAYLAALADDMGGSSGAVEPWP